MPEKFPVSDFYVTCASVIPVLFLAVAVQGRTALQSILTADVRAAQAKKTIIRQVFFGIAFSIILAGGVGEGIAIWVLYRGSEFAHFGIVVLVATLLLLVVVVAGPFVALIDADMQADWSAEAAAAGDQRKGPPEDTAGNGGQPGAS